MLNLPFFFDFFGRCLIAFYFLKAGINNAYNFNKVRKLINTKSIPYPSLMLLAVVITEIVGSFAIIFNFYVFFASIALIVFTLSTNFLICNYWTMEGLQRRNVSFVFYANIAVIGALLLISGVRLG